MYAHAFINIIKDDVAILEDKCDLPSKLELRFATEKDAKAIKTFIKTNNQQITYSDSSIKNGSAVILYSAEQQKVYGYAFAHKTYEADIAYKINRPFSAIPWVGLNQMMVAALRLKQRARKPNMPILEENYAGWGVFESDQEADEYLKRSANIRGIVSSGSEMKLDLSGALESIRDICDVRKSLLMRCGARI